jgi:hypothetical protein
MRGGGFCGICTNGGVWRDLLWRREPKSLQFILQISRKVDFFEDFSQKVFKTAEM